MHLVFSSDTNCGDFIESVNMVDTKKFSFAVSFQKNLCHRNPYLIWSDGLAIYLAVLEKNAKKGLSCYRSLPDIPNSVVFLIAVTSLPSMYFHSAFVD